MQERIDRLLSTYFMPVALDVPAPRIVFNGGNSILLKLPAVLGDKVRIWQAAPGEPFRQSSTVEVDRDVQGPFVWMFNVPLPKVRFAISTRITGTWSRIDAAQSTLRPMSASPAVEMARVSCDRLKCC